MLRAPQHVLHAGVCFRCRGGPCAKCEERCTAEDNRIHAGVCNLCRGGSVVTAAAAANSSSPDWTEEEKKNLRVLVGEHTDAKGCVRWADVTPRLHAGRSPHSAKCAWGRMRKADKAEEGPPPPPPPPPAAHDRVRLALRGVDGAASQLRLLPPSMLASKHTPAAALAPAPASCKRQKTGGKVKKGS